MRKVLIVGATSAIAQETARLLARDAVALCLVARNTQRLAAVADDLKVRGAGFIETMALDLNDLKSHEGIVRKAAEALGGLDAALIAHGALPNQSVAERSGEEVASAFSSNCLSVLSLVTHLANFFEGQRRGTIAVIGSVAGDRGKRSNYVYGAAKGAVDIFLEGLRARVYRSGVKVVILKPGPVDTPMTAHLPKNCLFSQPQRIGKGVYEAMVSGKDVAYLPWYWWWIMTLIKLSPGWLFKRMSL